MLSASVIAIAALCWLGLLFGVALLGERRPQLFEKRWAIVYALSLAIHCTSWTFYGTVTQASRSGWWLPPTFVGAILMYLFALKFLGRLVQLVREYNAGSLADLIAVRLGRHSGLAALVTAVVVIGIVPYIALQLKAVAMSYGILSHGQLAESSPWQDSALYVALLMALFAMLFGTRRASTMAHNRGLVLAMAFESLFKLGAMLALGTLLFTALPTGLPNYVPPPPDSGGFPALILLGALAMFTMPHQFYAGIVECRDDGQLRTARWLFPLYLLLISLPILPLARLGDAWLGSSGVSSDMYVLALPLARGEHGLALVAFLGGLSAATSMVVIATLALSLMVVNHFIAPLRVRAGWGRDEHGDLRGELLNHRRVAILVLILLAWAYSRVLARNEALADIGAISFSALAGLTPALLAAVYRPQLGSRAVMAGLTAGTLVWVYAVLPTLLPVAPAWLRGGPFGLHWLAPDDLLGLGNWNRLGRAVVVSLLANIVVMLAVAGSRFGRAARVVSVGDVGLVELRALAMRFLPSERVDHLFANAPAAGPAGSARVAEVEHELAAVIGAASARLLLEVVHRQGRDDLDTVVAIVGEAAQDLRFNQRVLEAALENMSQGICVVDAELRLVAWNTPYAQLFDYPPELLQVGRPVAELTRHNIDAGMLGPGETDARVQRRLAHMRAGTRHLSERRFPGDTIVEIRGNPMPDGGFVATFTDVTAFRQAEAALKRVNETLELRVEERTRELAAASAEAQAANASKSRFLTAVSHDLMQPLHAAQLFAHSLTERDGDAATAQHLNGALAATEGLLTGLLDVARLEGGRLHPQPRAFALAEILDPLAAEFRAIALDRGVRLDVVGTRAWVRSDPQLLRRVLQNFLSNALRYTEHGRVLLGVRRHGALLRVEVWDTGPGIASEEQQLIFQEFRRGSTAGGQGLGLGLSIAQRMADLLGHPLGLRSWPGRGSVFHLDVPLARAAIRLPPIVDTPRSLPAGRALVLDNEPAALAALGSLLTSWGWHVHAARNSAQALAAPWRPDLHILDFHLDGGQTGLEAWELLRARHADVPTVMLTADRDGELRQRLLEAGISVLYKPLKPLALRQVLQRVAAGLPRS
ncbi:histidine kinase [Rhodanobacter thiooxydans]|uniref:histidine kinase n=1 Tax=Rhodanobacter thiooxydans TaxID=416169 RepID=A0A154QD01_9GAMM|nr:PAS domain-containing hybrid sensor histidine kinase/response regulator [Rhodanobacter thiooxydans]EIL99409.1 putative two component regulator sensor histidine kinase/response regulator fusion transcriptional regulator [Rhodanobacter thiooxydans LCS2]KZC21833.1 histidine kinase [Rhodanobacter thiooxydans]MCW0201025.1 PAS domain-containing hybrid sensor histidine kinase/response regulator [Rhodanobacter thiooxydans]